MVALVCVASMPAHAYVGPGVGITMLGALWAVFLAIVFAIAGILIWPVRAFLRRRKQDVSTESEAGEEETKRDGMP